MDKVEMGTEDQHEMVAKAFVNHYYHLFDNNRAALATLYHHTSMLSFEGQKFLGVEQIGQKLTQLPFEQSKHFISTIDSQPSPFGGGILVFVSGNLQLSGEEHQLKFSQMFQLIPLPHGSFCVQNDMFRLNYG
ncbi:nuclear transport factor 2B [Cocos nucifera]|nr:nuclear transport factor 2B [Cocos nucifera]